jgi:hypothetical protein
VALRDGLGWDGHGDRAGKDRPQRAELSGLGFGTFGELDDLVRLPVGSPGQPAERAINRAAADGLGRGPDFGLAGPAVRRAPGYVVVARPHGHGSALRDREGKPGLPLLALFFGQFWKQIQQPSETTSSRNRFIAPASVQG